MEGALALLAWTLVVLLAVTLATAVLIILYAAVVGAIEGYREWKEGR